MKVLTTPWPALPALVPANCYRFFCKYLRTDHFSNETVLDIEGEEVTVPGNRVTVGLVDGKLCCDLVEQFAKQNGLV